MLNLKKHQVFKKILTLIRLRISFRILKEKKFLIFDAEESSHLFNYLKKNETEILNTRKEIINFWILLKCFFNFKLSYKYYLIFYIKTIKPKIIITLIDNNLFFYEIKKFYQCKTLSIQRGLRTEYNDIFSSYQEEKKDLSCDAIFVWNEKLGKKYENLIKTKIEVIGSFVNNIEKKIEGEIIKRDILYISTFRPNKDEKKIFKNLTWYDFIKNEPSLLKYLNNYCKKFNRKLSVIGRYDESNGEKDFFSKNFDNDLSFEYVKNYNQRDTYNICSNANLIITIDSTLGYEMLARGKKVAFFGLRPNLYPLNTRNFLYPEISKKGKFWINTERLSENEFLEIINYLNTVKENDWHEEHNYIKKNYISIDEGNNKFLNYIN